MVHAGKSSLQSVPLSKCVDYHYSLSNVFVVVAVADVGDMLMTVHLPVFVVVVGVLVAALMVDMRN